MIKRILIISVLIFILLFFSKNTFSWHRHPRHYFSFGIVFAPPPIVIGPPVIYWNYYMPPPPKVYEPPYYICPNRVWVPGYWEERWTPYGWERVWVPGYWRCDP